MQVEALKTWIRKRGYPDYLIKEHVEKTLRFTPSDENNSKKAYSISLVVTYGVENCPPPRSGLGFGLGLVLELGSGDNFPRTMTYNPVFKNLFQVIKKPFSCCIRTKRLKKCFHLPYLFPSEVQET